MIIFSPVSLVLLCNKIFIPNHDGVYYYVFYFILYECKCKFLHLSKCEKKSLFLLCACWKRFSSYNFYFFFGFCLVPPKIVFVQSDLEKGVLELEKRFFINHRTHTKTKFSRVREH